MNLVCPLFRGFTVHIHFAVANYRMQRAEERVLPVNSEPLLSNRVIRKGAAVVGAGVIYSGDISTDNRLGRLMQLLIWTGFDKCSSNVVC